MRFFKREIDSTDDITSEIVRLICRFSHRIQFMNKYSLETVFDYLRYVPYKKDEPLKEFVLSPDKAIKMKYADCKKKHIILASYCKNKGIPFRIVLSSNRESKDFHHIFIQCFVKGEWVNYDCTYRKNRIGVPKYGTNFKIVNVEC